MNEQVVAHLNTLFEHYPQLVPIKDSVEKAFLMLTRCFSSGGKVLVCGNGGSAADSEHIVGELMKSYLLKRPLSASESKRIIDTDPIRGPNIAAKLAQTLPAFSLVSQISLLSAMANDVYASMEFAQQVMGYGRSGDVLIALSTSGNSSNILHAAVVARSIGMTSISLTGSTGGELKNVSDITICAPSQETYRIQEYHLPIYHTLCAMLEAEFFGGNR